MNFVAVGHHHDPFDHVFQFTDIARPGIIDQKLHRFVRIRRQLPTEFPGESLGEMADQQRDVFPPLRQGW